MTNFLRTRAAACALATALLTLGGPAHALSVSGGHVVDAAGHRVQIKGVNWFGFETPDHAPHGLWARKLDDMLDQMQSLGFNAVRLPFCPATIHGATAGTIDTTLNPDLAGLNSLQLMDTVVARLDKRGMYVLLDHHRPDCNSIPELWYTGSYSEAQWIADLQFVADRYKADPHFLGVDLKNEPHGAATWGSGNAATDWNAAAERAGAAVLAKAPDALVFVEGITQNGDCTASNAGTWWGGNLGPQRCKPLALPANRLVLSPHVYGPDVAEQDYFNNGAFPGDMPAIWDAHFGALATSGAAVIIGETGGKYGQGDPKDKTFQDALVAYLESRGMFDLFYWCWNPNSADTGGILQDDWISVRADKMALLRGYWAAGAAAGGTVPRIVLGVSTIVVPEGGSASVPVSLSARPAANVNVKIAKAAGGDPDLAAASTSLVFTPSNYATPQPLVVRAAQDADTVDGSASFQLSATGLASVAFTASEKDDDVAPGRCTLAFDGSNAWNSGEVLSVTLANTVGDAVGQLVSELDGECRCDGVQRLGRDRRRTRPAASTAMPVVYDAVLAAGGSVTFGLVLGFAWLAAVPGDATWPAMPAR